MNQHMCYVNYGSSVALGALLWLTQAGCATTLPDAALEQQLVQTSQRLLNAVGTGDKSSWDNVLSAQGLFVDEESKVRAKSEVIDEITPLPPDTSGSLTIEHSHLVHINDTAVLMYDVRERENYHGQILESHYHNMDVYQSIGTTWQLIANQTMVLPAMPRPYGPPPADLIPFAGHYQLASGLSLMISAAEGHLYTQRGTDRPETLIALGGDVFARQDRPRSLRIFVRDDAGRVVSFLDRRDNEDVRWERLPERGTNEATPKMNVH